MSDTKQVKHTPGPWHLVGSEDGMYSNIQVLAEDGAFIVRVNSSNHANVANARLIAAAPELLEALKAVIDYYGHSIKTELADVAKAAIAKAEGR